MIISHKHRFIFLKTQKCAGSSIELALSNLCGPDDVITLGHRAEEDGGPAPGPRNVEIPPAYRRPGWRLKTLLGKRPAKAGTVFFGHMSARAIRGAMDPELFDAYRKVTVVRNPWDREVSLYYWAHRHNASPPPFERFVRRWRWRPRRKTFDIYSINGRIIADVVIRYETLKRDFASFVGELGVNRCPELPRVKGHYRPEGARDYRQFYTSGTRRIIEERYAPEIEAFGYTF